MCRLFGFRSVLLSQVHSSLISADNALMNQSEVHPDGWGVAYYIGQTPHIVRSLESAKNCQLFKKVSGVVSSHTVLAHIRKATKGNLSILNTHPFQFGRWTFAHNGNVKDLSKHKDELMKLVSPKLQNFLLGETDSEIIFKIILSRISKEVSLEDVSPDANIIANCIEESLKSICDIIGKLKNEDKGYPTQNYLTFILTNGSSMFGMQAGQPLYYSTYKNQCPERDTCNSFNQTCENKVDKGEINHLIFSSEPLQGENVWEKMSPGKLIWVGNKMNIFNKDIQLPFL